ncbi:MAG: FixH family protein [Chloroflexi bacterium]|nr:FixH family protein [Chloroflexota bacterium]
MRKMIFVSMLVGLTVLLAACGSSAPMQESTSSKDVNIVVVSNPSPAMMGDVELMLTITDKDGNPIEGAAVNVAADHTDMSGMGMNGLATDQDGGKYSIKANFPESGNWMLTVKVTKDSLDYKEDIEFKVQ